MTSQGAVKGNKHCTDCVHTGIAKNLTCSSITRNKSIPAILSGRVKYFQGCICLAILKCSKFPPILGVFQGSKTLEALIQILHFQILHWCIVCALLCRKSLFLPFTLSKQRMDWSLRKVKKTFSCI